MEKHISIIRIIGFWQWLSYSLSLDEARDWVLRVIYCHHNARVLSDMEWRFSCVLSEATRSMSKAYYDKDTMIAEVHEKQSEFYNEGYEDGQKDKAEELGVPGA